MLYRFKSRATGDLVMLEAHGKRLLEIIGKDPSGPGIILPAQVEAALAAIEAAVAEDERQAAATAAEAPADEEGRPQEGRVSLRHRSLPFTDMLRRCRQADVEVVWGV